MLGLISSRCVGPPESLCVFGEMLVRFIFISSLFAGHWSDCAWAKRLGLHRLAKRD